MDPPFLGRLVLPLPSDRLPPVAVDVTDGLELELELEVIENRLLNDSGSERIGMTGTDWLALL